MSAPATLIGPSALLNQSEEKKYFIQPNSLVSLLLFSGCSEKKELR